MNNVKENNIIIFWHIFQSTNDTNNKCQKIIDRQWKKINESGLYNATEHIYIGYISELPFPNTNLLNDKKITFIATAKSGNEFVTTFELKKIADQNSNKKICYIHSRGASRLVLNSETECADLWTEMLEYFNIEKWQAASNAINTHFTAGCELFAHNRNPIKSIYHYSGNFWWANSNYIKHLEFPVSNKYQSGEDWILKPLTEQKYNKNNFFILHRTNYKPYEVGIINSYKYKYTKCHYSHGGALPNWPTLFPISFGIPEAKIIPNITDKCKLIATIKPGNLKTYIFDNEYDYYKDYQVSLFGITKKKDGWDCLRHYEIMANGCLPVFENLEECPALTMTTLDMDTLLEINSIYQSLKHKTYEMLTKNEIDKCLNLSTKILDYCNINHTTRALAEYILSKSNYTVSKILFLSQDLRPDYLRCLSLIGFKELLGSNCHDFPEVPHIYTDYPHSCKNLYGKGMTYTKIINKEYRSRINQTQIIKNIKQKHYDLIVYGSCIRGMPFYNNISRLYDADRIILLNGEDTFGEAGRPWQRGNWDRSKIDMYLAKGHLLFIREMEHYK